MIDEEQLHNNVRNGIDSLKERELEFMKSKKTQMLIFSCGLGAVGFLLPLSRSTPGSSFP